MRQRANHTSCSSGADSFCSDRGRPSRARKAKVGSSQGPYLLARYEEAAAMSDESYDEFDEFFYDNLYESPPREVTIETLM